VGIQEVLERYAKSEQIRSLERSVADKNPKIQLKGLVGSSAAMVAAGCRALARPFVFVLPTHEDASYFLGDLESILDRQILFFPASFRKAFDFTQSDAVHVLQRAETLSALSRASESPKMIVTYPEAIAEKVVNRQDLEKNMLDISLNAKLDIAFINEFLHEYDFERVDFVYEPGQFAVRGGIVDIFSFSNDRPYRIEFFGDEVESIRTFDIESQLSVESMRTVTIVPNVQAKFLSAGRISLLEYVDRGTVFWTKDLQHALDVMQEGYARASAFWKALPERDIAANADWIDPRTAFTPSRDFAEMIFGFANIEFGSRFYYKPDRTISFEVRPQPSFNKDFGLLAHHFAENAKAGIRNLIFSDSDRQIERISGILDDMELPAPFAPVRCALHEGFCDHGQKTACYTDHQIFDRYYKYKRKKGYERSQAISLKELRDLKPGDYITHIDHGVGKYAGLEKVEVNGRTQEMIRLVYADQDLLYVNINSLNRISKYSGKEGAAPKMNKLGTDAWDRLKKTTKRKVKDIARDLIKLYAKRKAQTGNISRPYRSTKLAAGRV